MLKTEMPLEIVQYFGCITCYDYRSCKFAVLAQHSQDYPHISTADNTTLSQETPHLTVNHHLSNLSPDIQLSELVKFSEDSSVQMQLTRLTFC